MSTVELILLSVALAMDCFTVSVASGFIQHRLVIRTMLVTAVLFGFFQGFMPFLGWLGMSFFADSIQAWDHWIAFGLLAFLGVRMIADGLKPEEEQSFDPSRIGTTLTLSVATSIDALAVGLSFGCTGYSTFSGILLPICTIAAGSFLFSIAGFFIGALAGSRFKFPVEIPGGLILIGIGVKILIEHLAA